MQNLDCLPRKTLKQYVTGWTEPGESAAIEEHLKSCELCEQTIEDLERDPDTLMEFVRSSHKPEASCESRDAVADYALSRAKELVAPDAELSAEMNAAEVALAPPPSQDVGPYELLQPLGHGGMGAVYLARHRQLGKQVAIKLLPARAFRDDHYAARFQREIRAAGSLNHPAIINATDAGQHGSTHYLVMEYIDGLDVSRIARTTGRLSIADACAIMRTVALGLSHAHAAGVVHRDIKPSNLMISRSGQVKILDFGLAQITLWDEASAELTTVGQLMGTIDYMAPEQAERADLVDYRADLYSMGATLFRMLCGRAPLAATPNLSPLAKLRLLATSESPNLNTLREDAPPALNQLVHSLLARDPAHRPASAAHVAEQLAEFTADADLPALVASALANQNSTTEHVSTNSGSVDPLIFPTKAERAAGFAGRSWRWLTVAALAPLFILAGVLITLETQKGQLIIESADANVDVKLLKGGRVYQTVSVVPGVNTTRVYAGTYEVVIDSGSDRFELDGDNIAVKRGETVIAKLRSVPSAPRIAQAEAMPQSPVQPSTVGAKSDEFLYNREPLSYWLDQFARERSPTAIKEALAAISALVNPSNAQQITQPVLSALPQLDSQHDEDAFALIFKAQGDGSKYIDQLIRSLETGNEHWAARVLTTGIVIYMQRSTLPKGSDRNEPWLRLINWVAENGFHASSSGMLGPAARFLMFQVNGGGLSRELEDKLLDRLVSTPQLGADFWLAELPGRFLNRDSAWNPRYTSAVESKALEFFNDENSSTRDVAQAAILLTVLNGPKYNRAGMAPPPNPDKLRSALARRLRQLTEKPERLYEIVPVDVSFIRETLPILPSQTLFGVQTSVSQHTEACLIAVELLDLVYALGDCEACVEQVRAVHQALLPAATDFAVMAFGNPAMRLPNTRISFNWPALSISISGASGRPHAEPQALIAALVFTRAESVLPKDEQPTYKEVDRLLMTRWVEVRIGELDADKDGQLSAQEAQPEFPDPAKIDADQNGTISAEEIFEAYNAMGRFNKPIGKVR